MEVTKAISEEGGWSTWDLQMRETGIVIAKTANKASLWCVNGEGEHVWNNLWCSFHFMELTHLKEPAFCCKNDWLLESLYCFADLLHWDQFGTRIGKKKTFQYYITCCHFHWRTWIKCQSSGKFDKKDHLLVILLDWSVDLWERRLLIYRHCRRILRRDRGGKKCVFGMNLCLSENFLAASFFCQ